MITYPEGSKPKVTLLGGPKLPLHTIYAIWEQSKETGPLRSPEQIEREVDIDTVRSLFERVIKQQIPVGEAMYFTFAIEGISISWREQAVRHRIGTSADPLGLGADIKIEIIPDKSTSSFWSQSGRINDQSRFATDGQYRVPDSIRDHNNPDLLIEYHEHMARTQELYAKFARNGIPLEDAREIMPLGMTHRMTWTLNIQSLLHIISKRSCWILQIGIWGPVIDGIIQALLEVDPVFSILATPPCLKGEPREQAYREYMPTTAAHGVEATPAPEWTGCVYHEENARRYDGRDPLPPCSLHVTQHASPAQIALIDESTTQWIGERAALYSKLWRRDPWTGKRHLAVINASR